MVHRLLNNFKLSSLQYLLLLIVIHIIVLLNTTFIDWPEIIVFSWLMKQGLILYKDIIVVHSPGSIYLPYWFFSLTGFTVFWYRVFVYLFIIIMDILVYLLAIKLWKKQTLALFITSIYVFFQVPLQGNSIWQEFMFTPLMLISYYEISKYVYSKKQKYLFFVGVLFGISLIIKQNALYPFVGVILFLILFHRQEFIVACKRVLLFILIPLIIVLLLWSIYSINGLGEEFTFWVGKYPFLLIGKERSYITLPSVMLTVKIAAIYSSLFLSFALLTLKKLNKLEKQKIILIIIFCLSLIFAALPRWEEFRMQPSLPFAMLLYGFIINNVQFINKQKYFRTVFLFLTLPILIFSLQYVYRFYKFENPKMHQFLSSKQKQIAKEMNFYIGTNSFYLLGNYENYYYLLNRKPYVLPWIEHYPWLMNVASLDIHMIDRISKANITYIVLNTSEIPISFIPYLNQYYEHEYTLSDGGWILKKKSIQ